ncbi:PEP-CTERM system histidine kinase PrsK [Aestuariicella hydrocarbonica]|uniref:histidine kinase n=1 Tax=Pseudomaricurvus hydrocarbonicus TaxID=1470433 RepID=A0A9E5JQN3_9GAMM|nr:XrtA/PEP-CTERM system histidine kinase PrsK [Aestuariicella hydrocarbonica]NHO64709.1 PEP-CTERM system histidine kinase PrsK [Aestuariicella hydrocarbonica]
MIYSPGFYSYVLAFLGFFVLTILLMTSSRKKHHGPRLIIASSLSALWALQISLEYYLFNIPSALAASLEWLRYAAWFFFLWGVITSKTRDSSHEVFAYPKGMELAGLIVIALLSYLAVIAPSLTAYTQTLIYVQPRTVQISTLILLNIIGLGLIELIMRNSSDEQRWVVKFLCLGIGSCFAYDFFMYSESLLFEGINGQLWQARGVVNAFTIPLIAVSAARYSKLNLGIHVSRQIVLQSATVVGTGLYLLLMSAMGYYVRYVGGSWGSLLQIMFLFGSGLVLASLLFSHKLRKTLNVLLSKHFYSYKYDYRQKWLEFTHNLANTEGDVPQRSCQAIASLVHSSGALLWCKDQNQRYELLSHWNIPEPEVNYERMLQDLTSLDEFLESSLWVIDMDEFRDKPDKYSPLTLPEWLTSIPNAWLITPFILQNKILGFALLKKSDISTPLNWEDRDLLKMAGQQTAIHLAQYRSETALMEARQFEAYNRLSTYVMHDLKNILAQQSLIISNSEKHRHKQEFVDDVLRTIENSVERMTRLLGQMKRGSRGELNKVVSITQLLSEVVNESKVRNPKPTLTDLPSEEFVSANYSQLKNVFGHLIQNAQEATPDTGRVHLSLTSTETQLQVLISDTGQGMSADFIKERLFKPFDSTKGLMGMGIGAFESKQYINSLGGDIRVQSVNGQGSQFIISLPRQLEVNPDQDDLDNDCENVSEIKDSEQTIQRSFM